MNGYIAFTKKEFTENAKKFRLFIMLALFVLFGLLSPLTAKFMPSLMSTLAPNLNIALEAPSALDSWEQFYKNVSQLGMSIMVIIYCNCLSSEYSKGTLVNMLTKGLSRPAVILSKFTASATIMSVSYWVCFGITYSYTAYFWPEEVLAHTFFAAFALWVMGLMYLCILMVGCVLFRQAFSGIIFFLGVSTILGLLALPKPLAKYNPNILTTKNVDLLSGVAAVSEFIVPMIIAVLLSAAFLSGAVILFNRKQL